MWIVTIIYWLQAFVAPVIIFGVIGITINNKTVLIILLVTGAVVGIIFAEYIRRKVGLATFFARIYGPNQMDEKIKRKSKQLFYKLSSDDKPLPVLK
jgi:hypothetical protein